MQRFVEGDRVRVDIPDEDDPDHRYHGEFGEITSILEDGLSGITGYPQHDYLYTVGFDDDLEAADFRYDDLELLED